MHSECYTVSALNIHVIQYFIVIWWSGQINYVKIKSIHHRYQSCESAFVPVIFK